VHPVKYHPVAIVERNRDPYGNQQNHQWIDRQRSLKSMFERISGYIRHRVQDGKQIYRKEQRCRESAQDKYGSSAIG